MIKKKGFSLIELLVVIAIIALLSSVILTSLSSARSKSRDAKRIADIKQLMNALELYHNSVGHYPYSDNCRSNVPNTSWCNSVQSLYDGGKRWISDSGTLNVLKDYISSEPKDPIPKSSATSGSWTVQDGIYFYYARNQPLYKDTYFIVFSLENNGHPLEKTDGVYNCSSTLHDYGESVGGNNGIITMGASCPL